MESNMRQAYLIPLALAALIASSAGASAQGFRDDPPGWAFQKRGIIESNGGDPFDYRYRERRYGGWNGWEGAYAWQPVRPYRDRYRHRNWR
jgi:hypothetical protein